jgi:dTDP-4-amino-4,6-dideoxygalactose transaminase
METKYYHKYIGWNARLDALQAAMLRVKLRYVESWIEARQRVAAAYDRLIEESELDKFLIRPLVKPERRHVFGQYTVRVPHNQRDPLLRFLKSENIGCEVYYPVPLHLQECLAPLGYRQGDFPVSEEASQCVLALPMYPELSESQQKRILHCCAQFVRQPGRLAA